MCLVAHAALSGPSQTIFDFNQQINETRPRLNSNEVVTTAITHTAPWMMTANSLGNTDEDCELSEDDLYAALMT